MRLRAAWVWGRRLVRLLLYRPAGSVLVLGGATLASNWLWFGSGLFVGRALGGLATVSTGLGLLGALVALWCRRRQLTALLVLTVLAVGLPAAMLITVRAATGVPLLMHDGAYQTEEAMRALLQGRDPYGLDYSQTSMRRWHWYVNEPLDPSLFRYVYYPLTFLAALPGYGLANAAGAFFDFRVLLLLAAAGCAVAVLALPWRWEWRYVLLAAIFLDPLFFLPQGRNDILFLAAVVGGTLALARRRPLAGAWAFGVALAFKQFAIFYLPLLAAALLSPRARHGLTTRGKAGALVGLGLPLFVTALPFLVWQPAAFLTDTAGHVTGTVAGSYPIRGYGLSALLLALHVFPNNAAYFPFGLLQLAVAVPLLGWGLRRVWRRPTYDRVLQAAIVVLAAALFCSRYLNDNHLAVLLALAVLGGGARRAEAVPAATDPALVRRAA